MSDFHEFYAAVEKAHRLLTERFSLKSGQDHAKVEVDEQGEEEEEEEEELLEFQEQTEDVELPGSDCESGSFSNEQFLSEVIAQQGDSKDFKPLEEEFATESEVCAVKEVEEAPVVPLPQEERRETRSSAKSKSLPAAEQPQPPPKATKPSSVSAKARAKRSKTVDIASNSKSKRYANYKQCMLDIDAKISAHMRLTCDVCHEGQETFLLLCKHMMQAHHRKGYAVCCNKKFYKRSFLTDHIDRHADPEKFK